MPDWLERPLEECLEALIDYRGKSPTKSASGIPVISAKVVKSGRIEEPIEQTIAPGYYGEWMRRGLPIPGDVIMTTEGPLGEVAQLDERTAKFALGQRIVTMRGKRGVLHDGFLKFLLQSPDVQHRLASRATGTTVLGISQKSLRELAVPLPPWREQEEIAELLGSLDDKIELNRRMSETLEAMAQAIFRDWFVDFGPVRRKLDGASDPVNIMGGVTQNKDEASRLAAIFPGALGADGLPEGWEECTLSDLVELNPKEPLKKGIVAPYTDMAALPTSGPTADLPAFREFGSGMRFRNGDALLARITPCLENGKSAYVDFLPDDQPVGWGSTEFIVLRSKPPVPGPFAYLMVRHPEFRERAIQSMTGTSGRQRAQSDTLATFPFAKATPDIFLHLGELIQPMFNKISSNERENQSLADMRDLLLPKLMSGEIRLKDAEKIVKAAE